MSNQNPAASPSDLAQAGTLNVARRQIVPFYVQTTAVGTFARHYITAPCRVAGVIGFRRTAGDTNGTTTMSINAKIGTEAAATILDAPMSFAQADGDDLKVTGVISGHADFDGHGIPMSAGDYIELEVTAVETSVGQALSAQVELILG